MPNPVYGKKELVWVKPYDGAVMKYGFRTSVDDDTKVTLGQALVLSGTYPSGFVLGANMPKPPRASKLNSSGATETSWCSSDSITGARAAGWTVSPGRFIPGGSSTKRAKVVYVTIGGIKYAWRMPLRSYQKIGAFRNLLNIKDALDSDDDLVFGASYPKVPRVAYALNSPVGSKVSTYCDPEVLDNLPDGWTTVRAQSKSRY